MSVSISGAGSISGLDQGFNVTTGSVGIGTDVPQGELHVKRTSSTGRIIVEGAALAQIGLRDNAGGTDSKVIQIRNSAQNLLFGTQTDSYQSFSEKVRITSGGDMGLGTATPTSFGPTFQVAGTDPALLLQDTATAVDYFGMNIASGAVNTWFDDASAFVIHTATGLSGSGLVERLRIDSSGNLLLKTGEIDIQGGNKTVKTSAGFLQVGTSGSHYLSLITAGSQRLNITSAGLVGINCTPLAQFQVKAGTNQNIALSSMSSEASIEAYNDAGSANVPLRLRGQDFKFYTSSTERLRITSDGKLCVNTTLSSYGVVQIRDASGDSTTSAIQVENASSGNSTTNVILRSVSLNSGAWANAQYRAKSHDFCFQTTPAVTVLGNFGPWSQGDKGHTRGTIHLRPASTDHMGGAITFGASDSSSGETAMAGIYTRTDGTYGSRMYFATTNSYATGPKNAMLIDDFGYVVDTKKPFIYGSVTNTNGSGIANSMHVESSRNLSFSNSRITVPVSGIYHICFNTICDSTVGRVDAHIRVNGSTKVNSLNDTNTNGYHYRGMSISIMLSANDYIEFNNNDWYNAGTTTMEYWRTASVVFIG